MIAALFLVAGVAVVISTFSDVFQSVIVPRPARWTLRPSAHIARYGWRAWRWFGHAVIGNERREDFLGTFAPLLLVVLIVFWIVSLVFGYGCIFYGLRGGLKPSPDFNGAIYFAGTSLLTIGFGDIVPLNSLTRYLAIATGASGFGTVAILTTFLFSIFGAYQSRETFVLALTNRAGAPPSGLDLVEIHARLRDIDGLIETLHESQMWISAMLETHLAYPVLNYFRSTHDNISWVGALGAVLDASTIVITTLDLDHKAEAKFVNRLGRHFVSDFAHHFGFDEGVEVGIERSEFDVAYDRLAAAGVPLIDRTKAWFSFVDVRSTYAGPLNAMAQFWRIPPAQWVGDRSLIGHHPPLKVTGTVSVAQPLADAATLAPTADRVDGERPGRDGESAIAGGER
jgi:hypothetical protein